MSYQIVSPSLGKIKKIKFNEKEINVLEVIIENDEFDLCIDTSKIYDSNTWNENEYRKGFLNNKRDESFNTEEVGTLTERAICKIFGLIQDGNMKKGGCDYDFVINNKTFDAKGSKCFRGLNYIKAINENGYKCKLKSDFYFLSYINNTLTNRNLKKVAIDVVGVISKKNIEKLVPVLSPTSSKHFNYEIKYDNPNIIPINLIYDNFINCQNEKGLYQQINGLNFKLLYLKPIKQKTSE